MCQHRFGIKAFDVYLISTSFLFLAPSALWAATFSSLDKNAYHTLISPHSSVATENYDQYQIGEEPTTEGVEYSATLGTVVVTDTALASTAPNVTGSTSFSGTTQVFFLPNEELKFSFAADTNTFAIDINTFAIGDGDYVARFDNGEVVNSKYSPFRNTYCNTCDDFETGQFIGHVSEKPFKSVTVSATTGFAYNVDTLNFGMIDNLSSPAEPIIPVSNKFTGKERGLLGDVNTSGERAFNYEKPTIIVTHGWQRGGNYQSGEISSSLFSEQFYNKIKEAYNGEVNVVVLTWEEAYVGLSGGAKLPPILDDVGLQLGQQLKALFESEGGPGSYSKPLHFIGHSYGSKVNAAAVEFLTKPGRNYLVDHVTILDAPTNDNVPENRKLNEDDFTRLANNPNVTYVENYYGSDRRLNPAAEAFGAVIEGTQLAGGYPVAADHTGVWEEYLATVSGQTDGLLKFPAFLYSAALEGVGGRFNDRPINNFTAPTQISQSLNATEVLAQSATYTVGESGFGTTNIGQASDGFLVLETTVPFDFTTLAFDLFFSEKGDGDWLETLFGDDLLFQVKGETFPDEQISFYLDLGRYAGRTGFLSFLLASDGPEAASVELTNMRYITYEHQITPVPVPAALPLLLTALAGLSVLSGRRRLGTS